MPPARADFATAADHEALRLVLALAVDLLAITCVAGALVLLAGAALGSDADLPYIAVTFAILGVLYLVVARQTVGSPWARRSWTPAITRPGDPGLASRPRPSPRPHQARPPLLGDVWYTPPPGLTQAGGNYYLPGTGPPTRQ